MACMGGKYSTTPSLQYSHSSGQRNQQNTNVMTLAICYCFYYVVAMLHILSSIIPNFDKSTHEFAQFEKAGCYLCNSFVRGRWWTQQSWWGPPCTSAPSPAPRRTPRRCTLEYTIGHSEGLTFLKMFDGWKPSGHGIADTHRLTDMDCPVHEVVVDDLILDWKRYISE